MREPPGNNDGAPHSKSNPATEATGSPMPKDRIKSKQPSGQPSASTSNPSEREKMGDNGRETENSALTPRQRSALPIIAASPTMAQAARASGIGQTTLYRWIEDDEFREELTRLREESAQVARRELQGLMLRSVSVLADAMEDSDKAVRLRAARYAMSFAVRICEIEALRKQVQELEEVIPLWAVHPSPSRLAPK